jgi:hypothetical protein
LGKQQEDGIDLEEELEGIIPEMDEILATTRKRKSSANLKRRSTRDSLSKTNNPQVMEEMPKSKKLIEEERSETGNIKLSVFTEYFKTAGVGLSIASIVFNIAASGKYITK